MLTYTDIHIKSKFPAVIKVYKCQIIFNKLYNYQINSLLHTWLNQKFFDKLVSKSVEIVFYQF